MTIPRIKRIKNPIDKIIAKTPCFLFRVFSVGPFAVRVIHPIENVAIANKKLEKVKRNTRVPEIKS